MSDRRGRVGTVLIAALVLVVLVPIAPSPASADGNEAPAAPLAFRRLSAGGDDSCAISHDGELRCWGANGVGQLGIEDSTNRGAVPDQMGLNLPAVLLGSGRTATSVSAGQDHACAVLDDATVRCWGYNDRGQLGIGSTFAHGSLPGSMTYPPVDLGTGRTALAVSAGVDHTCALLDTHAVKCWGDNDWGQLGIGASTSDRRGDSPNEMGDNLPAVNLGTGRTATAISAGNQGTCALLDDATVKCWGLNAQGQLGLGDKTTRGLSASSMGDNLPIVNLGTGRTATAISTAGNHTCALLDNGTLKCWGANYAGQLGLGDTSHRGDATGEMGDSLPAVDLGTGRTAIAITAGSDHTCALLDNGTIKCWGTNNQGQLGLGAVDNRGNELGEMGDNLPAVDLGTGRTATAVAAGASHTCALLDDGTVKCWGTNNQGQLGLGDQVSRGDQPGEMGDHLLPSMLLGPAVVGHVTAAGGSPALPGALVAALRTTDFSIAGGGGASASGQYGFGVGPGTYFLYALDANGAYNPGFVGAPTSVGVTDQPVVTEAELTPRLGAIAGTVTETGSGTPVAGAFVVALTAGGTFEKAVVADATGHFTVPDLRPGAHRVAYVDPTGTHAVRYHPSASSIGTDTPVTVTAGATATADGTLPAQAPVGTGHALSGRITESGSGTPIAGALVVALRASDLSFARATQTNSTGGYALNLAAGTYELAFIDAEGLHAAEWFDDQPATGLAAATAVAAPGVADASLAPSTGAIEGTITTGGSPLAGCWVVVVGSSGVAASTTTAADGSYEVDHLRPDSYRLGFVDPVTGANEYWPDGPAFADAAVIALPAGQTAPIDGDL